MRSLTAALLLVAFGAGCSPAQPYLTADRATYLAIAPEYRDYVVADESLSPARQALRLDTPRSWEERLRAYGAWREADAVTELRQATRSREPVPQLALWEPGQ